MAVSAGTHSEIGSVFDCRSRGREFDPGSGPILSWSLIKQFFLRSFSSFHLFKKGCCQLQVKVCAQQSTG